MVDMLYCVEHTKRRLECYCNPCKEPVCTDCIVQSHNGHSVELLSTVYKRITDQAKEQQEKIDNILLPKYKEFLFNETAKQSALTRRAEEIKKNIETHTQNLVEMIKTIGAQTVEDLSKKEKDGLQEIEQTKNNFKKKINELQLISSTISTDIEARPDISFFNMHEKYDLKRFETTPPNTDYSLTDFQPGDIERVLQDNFGIRPILHRSRNKSSCGLEGGNDSQPIQEPGEVDMMEDQDVYPPGFGDMVEHTKQVHVERKVDIAFFIKLTARPALAMVKDPEDSGRTTERVKILLELLHQETKGEKLNFMQGIGRHLAALMKEKEETMGQSAETWLYAEATKRDCINSAGTFWRARNQCIIEKLSPILAGIIAQLDTNSNLDLLIQRDPSSWEHKLWLEIINNPSATQIEYSMVVSPKKQEELPEVIVKGTGCDGLKFKALMPFSWLIYRLIDQILRTSQNIEKHVNVQESVMSVLVIVEKTTLGKVLQKCLSEVKVIDCLKAYLSDFVHMVYHVTSQEEHGLVYENLLNGINMEFREGLPSVVMNFVAIHAVYSKTEPRLRNFASITRVWPGCSERIIEFQQKSAQFYLVTDQELTLDVLGLFLLLKSLEPNKDSLTDQKGRQLWQKQVHKYRPVVERILGQFVTEGHQTGVEEFGRRCMEGIREARCVWTKVVVMKLFLQHVCSDEVMPVERLMTLWVMLRDNVDFKDIESLEKVEKFLKLCMKNSVTKVFGYVHHIVNSPLHHTLQINMLIDMLNPSQ
uniref:B box-type domain-containing protein n=1 Tax=Magallana gigas TaxID=29159 RepID=A0A8W8MG84_MAGGI